MMQIENSFPKVKKYELFTGDKMEDNIKLYKTSGYREFYVRSGFLFWTGYITHSR